LSRAFLPRGVTFLQVNWEKDVLGETGRSEGGVRRSLTNREGSRLKLIFKGIMMKG